MRILLEKSIKKLKVWSESQIGGNDSKVPEYAEQITIIILWTPSNRLQAIKY